MSAGLGMDLVRIARIRRVLKTIPNASVHGFYSDRVSGYADRGAGEVASLAARFAAKEAALKALGTGRGSGIGWKDVEVQRTGLLEHQFCCSTVPLPIGHVCWDYRIGGSV